MSSAQLDKIIADVVRTFGAWGPQTTLHEMRKGWDDLFSDVKPTVGAKSEKVDAGGVKAEWITAPGAAADRVILYFHGGGYVLGSIHSHRDMCERLSRAAQARVLALDYRLAPEHPFPAPVEDARAAYRWLLKQGLSPKRIAFAGDSAGGGLTFAALLALKQHGDPMPACAAPLSPWVDLEGLGESMTTRSAMDPMVQKPMILQMAQTYLGGASARDPLAAPLYGDLAGLPPLLIQVGARETLHDDAVRMAQKAKKAGVEVELDVWEGQIHVWQIFANRLDEGEKAIQKIGAFAHKHTS
ncbi:MAG TPA: alpha/beta hydrolase [Candidatus Binatia bacterium]|nr:alpha/beta hydrolase [Candidatus Binatia bacterium]